MERKPLRPTSLSVSSTTTGSPTEGLLKESGDTGKSGGSEKRAEKLSFYVDSGRVVEGDARFRIGILHLCGLYATETNAAGDILYDEISFGGEMRKSVRTKCGCLLDCPEWLPEELRNCPMESLSICPNRTSLRELLTREDQIISLPFGVLRLKGNARPSTPASNGRGMLQDSVERLVEMLRRVPHPAGFFEASTGNSSMESREEVLPLSGVRSILRDPAPPNLAEYHAILLLSSENWKIVVDWGIRLVDQGKNVLAVHFKKGSEAQAADVYMSARRRAKEINPLVNFEMTIRPPCPYIVPIAVDLSKYCSLLVMGDSGRKDTRYKKMFVVGVGARDQEGALRALSMAFVLARAAGDGRGANVVIIYIPVQPWQFGQQEDILSIGYKSSQLLQSVQDTVQRLETQHPGVKVTLKMGNPTDRMHVQDELLSTAERNGIILKPTSPPTSPTLNGNPLSPSQSPPILVVGGGHNSDCGELGSVTSQFVDKGVSRLVENVGTRADEEEDSSGQRMTGRQNYLRELAGLGLTNRQIKVKVRARERWMQRRKDKKRMKEEGVEDDQDNEEKSMGTIINEIKEIDEMPRLKRNLGTRWDTYHQSDHGLRLLYVKIKPCRTERNVGKDRTWEKMRLRNEMIKKIDQGLDQVRHLAELRKQVKALLKFDKKKWLAEQAEKAEAAARTRGRGHKGVDLTGMDLGSFVGHFSKLLGEQEERTIEEYETRRAYCIAREMSELKAQAWDVNLAAPSDEEIEKTCKRMKNGKAMERIKEFAGERLLKYQFGFRSGKSCRDPVRLLWKKWECTHKIASVFVDFQKAFDSLTWESSWRILESTGMPRRPLYEGGSESMALKSHSRAGRCRSHTDLTIEKQIPVQPWQFGQQEDILSIGYKSSQLLQSVQDTVQRLETQHPGVKVTLKMGNPTDRMHVQDELLSTAERNGNKALDEGEGL
ncbi:hypothetical protein Pmar_PMAR007497 [Perkinsus marinus ATCC 50983]|uniref:Reverse transcriptase domain-containing protein n=1 Tax=Perkinsus marinus (strain ATCC 50983 / TXsc) TaxID=423536 RepID=C5M069_PERM5|nr:hypothetical protein Pmar_PMAR007497 [Perkinsus marinus ATCC 50983]EEQ97647.1 hypothetical protein Pmar_PMAR007497 [Perkinsus marinus ATCC 50983]|eukprot:XP_002764930.1 hypothetical protein Pmar_PMAR007497 [Perkinsus marinus ATCC 50983]